MMTAMKMESPRRRMRMAIALLALGMACSVHAEECKDGDVMIGATRYRQMCMALHLLPDEFPFMKYKQGRIVEMRVGKRSEIQELPKGTITSPTPGTPIEPRPVK